MNKKHIQFQLQLISFGYTLLVILFIISLKGVSQNNDLYENLKKGIYKVGFQEIQLKDYSRIYKNGFRSIQLSLWYPIKEASEEKVKLGDYLSLYNSEDDSEDTVVIYSFWKNQLTRSNKSVSFDKIFQSNSLASYAPLPERSKYPLILYAAGGQGESFENFLICEILASHGFIVAAIPSVGTYIHEMEINQEGLLTQTQDLQAVLGYLNQTSFVDFRNVGAFGWSWGGLSTLYLQTQYPYINAFVSMDGSIAGYHDILESMPHYGIEKITAPSLFFTTSEDTKIRAKSYVDQLLYCPSTFVSLDSIQHGDFNSYSFLSNVFADTLVDENIMNFHPFLINSITDFFYQTLVDNNKEELSLDQGFELVDTIIYYQGVEAPLRQDQLISLIKDLGADKGLEEYLQIKENNPAYIPFESFELTKLAFSLQRDSVRASESVMVMEIVTKEYPNSASSFALKGRIHEIRKEYPQALLDFRKALSLKAGKTQAEEVVFYEDINWYNKRIEALENKITNN